MKFKRYTVQDVLNNQFYQLPKFLFQDEFKKLSNDAKVLYALLRDRHDLSIKNNWFNNDNQIYLIYTRQEMAEMLNVTRKTATKAFDELVKIGLVEEERQGLNKPNLIFLTAVTHVGSRMGNIYPSGGVDITHQDGYILPTNNTDINNTDINNNNKIKNQTKDTTTKTEKEKDVVVKVDKKNKETKKVEKLTDKILNACQELNIKDNKFIVNTIEKDDSVINLERMLNALTFVKVEYINKDRKINNILGLIRSAYEKSYKIETIDPVAIKNEKRLARERREWEMEMKRPKADPEVAKKGLEMLKEVISSISMKTIYQ